MELDVATRHKLDDVLQRVKEPQSELSLAELGLVSKFTFSAESKTIQVHFDLGNPGMNCRVCTDVNTVVNGIVRDGLERSIADELAKEFPGFAVEFYPLREKS